jgi:hypothetical protein
MSVLTTFLRGVVYSGRMMFREPWPAYPDADTAPMLEEAYRLHALGIAGPAIPFDARTALAAARVLCQAGWYVLQANTPVNRSDLTMPADPQSPSEHLSADLLLRYLPAVYRRARALRPSDELTGLLAELLRRWPLSGVLAIIEDGPLTPTDFGGHLGLQLLYAERLAAHEKPEWVPGGAALEAFELVKMAEGQ